MIFVTVGTHEQQFNRLVEYMDMWAKRHAEEVVIQTGFSTYEPKYAEWKKFLGYNEMRDYINKARIVITHGGPSSFIVPLHIGKVPVVVPRRKEFGEHVNNHQLTFCREVAIRKKNIIEVEDIEQIEDLIDNYSDKIQAVNCESSSNNVKFCDEFGKIVGNILGDYK